MHIRLDTYSCTHHAYWPEGHDTVTTVAVGPGIPARILTLLQDKHFPTEVSLLKANKAKQTETKADNEPGTGLVKSLF